MKGFLMNWLDLLRRSTRRCFSPCMVFALALVASKSLAFEACGELKNPFGPFDYRIARPEDKDVVERRHFTPRVEHLVQGQTVTHPGGDIEYTLRVFPNHPRALFAMVRLGEKENRDKPIGSPYTISCWFDRAIRFTPNDGSVRLVFGIYLSRKGRNREAIEQLQAAQKLGGDPANVHYNLGLAYFDLKEYEKSLEHAAAAYDLGFPLAGLRNKLRQVGKWRDMPVPSASAATDPAQAASGEAR
jgi:tetratricopeptide (TPR) repeat protein